MPKLFATGNSEISSREKRNMERARKVASQGMVLLENKGALPICLLYTSPSPRDW